MNQLQPVDYIKTVVDQINSGYSFITAIQVADCLGVDDFKTLELEMSSNRRLSNRLRQSMPVYSKNTGNTVNQLVSVLNVEQAIELLNGLPGELSDTEQAEQLRTALERCRK